MHFSTVNSTHFNALYFRNERAEQLWYGLWVFTYFDL